MRLKTWVVAALGLGSLVTLMAVSMLASARTAQILPCNWTSSTTVTLRMESMLDDLGLQAGLEWHVRDFMSRYTSTVDTIAVDMTVSDRELQLSFRDDGVGIHPGDRGKGLALTGMHERVKERRGSFNIEPDAAYGTATTVRLPLPASVTEARLASVAG